MNLSHTRHVETRMSELLADAGLNPTRNRGVHWLIDHADPRHAQELLGLAAELQRQGTPWHTYVPGKSSIGGSRHNVNVAMALKVEAITYRMTRNASLRNASHTRMRGLDAHCGQPTGLFIGDEEVPDQPTHSPVRGSELCSVVEAMYSHAVSFATFGDVGFLDRTERLAFNALPATWASKRGGDMWSHQYFQRTNQVDALPTFNADGFKYDGHAHGVATGFACCTANFNQGWPKFAQSIFYESPSDRGLVVGLLAPALAKLPDRLGGGGVVETITDYPFADNVTVRVTVARALPLYIRLPGWAHQASLDQDGKSHSLSGLNGTLARVSLAAGDHTLTLQLRPAMRLERWAAGSVSVHRGGLMYSLPLEPNLLVRRTNWGITDAAEFNATTSARWRYALVVDQERPDESLTYEQHRRLAPGQAPFNQTGGWPCSVRATVRLLPDDALYLGEGKSGSTRSVKTATTTETKFVEGAASSAAGRARRQLLSPACSGEHGLACGSPQSVQLVPHGATILRIGMLPIA